MAWLEQIEREAGFLIALLRLRAETRRAEYDEALNLEERT